MMGCTVAELGERMSGRELNDWLAYEALEPFGEEQADRRAALLAHVLIAVNTDKKNRGKVPSIDALMQSLRPGYEVPRREQSIEELKASLGARARKSSPSAPKRGGA